MCLKFIHAIDSVHPIEKQSNTGKMSGGDLVLLLDKTMSVWFFSIYIYLCYEALVWEYKLVLYMEIMWHEIEADIGSVLALAVDNKLFLVKQDPKTLAKEMEIKRGQFI